MSTIIQKPLFSTTLTPLVKITFLLDDVRDRYPITVGSVANVLKAKNFIIQGGATVYNDNVYQVSTMLIPSLYIKTDDDIHNLKNFLKLICKRQEMLCFFEFGATQRVYDYRNFNK